MFWNLVVNRYEKYHLSHLMMLIVLSAYSLLGALCFCALEAANERHTLARALDGVQRKSALARDRLLYDLQYFFVKHINVSRLLSSELNTTLDYYDRMMGFDAGWTTSGGDRTALERRMKWSLWGGLYFAGTIYTTIGYGDIVTETVGGKLFTVVYAIVGIPLVITVLNVWGNGLYQLLQWLWTNYLSKLVRRIYPPAAAQRRNRHRRHFNDMYDDEDYDEDDDDYGGKRASIRYTEDMNLVESGQHLSVDGGESSSAMDDDLSKLPLSFAFSLLIIWIMLCATVNCFVHKWSFFESAYFFFISLTTIGLGDSLMDHRDTCMYFILILIGLAVVSMSIGVIQLKIEAIFARIIRSIDNDFRHALLAEKRKHSIGTSIGEERKISANTVAINVPRPSIFRPPEELEFYTEGVDAAQKYGQNMSFSDKLLLRMMSHHQRRLLNEKMNERRRMRAVGTQTEDQRKITAAAQTDQVRRIDDLQQLSAQYAYESSDESDEETPPASVVAQLPPGAMRRTVSAGANQPKTFATTLNANAAAAARRSRVGATAISAAAVPGTTRHHRSRGLTRKKLYIYNIGD